LKTEILEHKVRDTVVTADVTAKVKILTITLSPARRYKVHGAFIGAKGDTAHFHNASAGYIRSGTTDDYRTLVGGCLIPQGRASYDTVNSEGIIIHWFDPPRKIPPSVSKLFIAFWNPETAGDVVFGSLYAEDVTDEQ
jgi:hypothetical protein